MLQDQKDDLDNIGQITSILKSGDAYDAKMDSLIPLIYDELRQLAARKLNREPGGQTLQATALVHETYLRLKKPASGTWENRRHFFGAAAEAMRRILIENARRKRSLKRGGNMKRSETEPDLLPLDAPDVDILDLDTALNELETLYPRAAEMVKLRYFSGLTMQQVAEALDISRGTAHNIWVFAKAWLYRQMNE